MLQKNQKPKKKMEEINKLAAGLDKDSQEKLLEYAKSLHVFVKADNQQQPDEQEFTEYNHNLMFKRNGEQVVINYCADSNLLHSITVGRKKLIFCCGAVSSYYDGVGIWKQYDINSGRLVQVMTTDAKIDSDPDYPIHLKNSDSIRLDEYRKYATDIASHLRFTITSLPVEFELIYNKYREYYRT